MATTHCMPNLRMFSMCRTMLAHLEYVITMFTLKSLYKREIKREIILRQRMFVFLENFLPLLDQRDVLLLVLLGQRRALLK
jgi:hypothetical protein